MPEELSDLQVELQHRCWDHNFNMIRKYTGKLAGGNPLIKIMTFLFIESASWMAQRGIRRTLKERGKSDTCRPVESKTARIGGRSERITESYIVEPKIEIMPFGFEAHPLIKLGEVEGREVDVVIGTETMERWDIKLDPSRDELDLSGLKRKEFTEFEG